MRKPFKHNSHQAAIIILVILYFACVFLLILYNNHVYIVFTAVLVCLGIFWQEIHFGHVCK